MIILQVHFSLQSNATSASEGSSYTASPPLPRKTKLQHIFEEIYTTESSLLFICVMCAHTLLIHSAAGAYVASLETLRVVYYQPLKVVADHLNRKVSASESVNVGSSGGRVAPMLSMQEIDCVFGNILFIHAIHKQFFSHFQSLFQPGHAADEVTVTAFTELFTPMFVKVLVPPSHALFYVHIIIFIVMLFIAPIIYHRSITWPQPLT